MYETYSTGIKNVNEIVFIQRHSVNALIPGMFVLGFIAGLYTVVMVTARTEGNGFTGSSM